MSGAQASTGCIEPRPLTQFPLYALVVDIRILCELGLHLPKTPDRLGNTTILFENVTYRAVNHKPWKLELGQETISTLQIQSVTSSIPW